MPMDLPGLVRRFSSDKTGGARPESLSVDTSLRKRMSSTSSDNNEGSPEAGSGSPPMSGAPGSARFNRDDSAMLRRRRSNSECLLLAKTKGPNDLPGPCQEYISTVKRALAKSEEHAHNESMNRPAALIRRSTSFRGPSSAPAH